MLNVLKMILLVHNVNFIEINYFKGTIVFKFVNEKLTLFYLFENRDKSQGSKCTANKNLHYLNNLY